MNRDRSRPPDLRAGPGPSDTKGRKRSGVWEEQQLSSCALCQDVLKDPVSTSCGHWFCRQCSGSYWDQSDSSVDPPCPQCGERTRTVAAANQIPPACVDRLTEHPVKKLLSQLLPLSESVQSEEQAAGPPPPGPPELVCPPWTEPLLS
ncbi:unnamed protein product [Menidia menidia]|uniref:(Atlantic silverside) hypothetical protein n=1 Tax=Menidia menidia TaxID=238744 RepID=A0A8S4BGR5_9TELE|nr:unnamed protein product [Menidia menidia]